MSRVLTIPDVHQTLTGLEYAKKRVNEYDYIICMGDIVDTHDSSDHQRTPVDVLTKWVGFKKEYPEKVFILLGNHDLSYLPNADGNVSSHQPYFAKGVREFLVSNLKYFDICKRIDGVYYSHAGISETWYNNIKGLLKECEIKGNNVAERINNALHSDRQIYGRLFDHCGFDPSGNSFEEGPLWIRPAALICNPKFDKQVVAHTGFSEPTLFVGDNKRVLFVDVDNQFVDIINGNLNRVTNVSRKYLKEHEMTYLRKQLSKPRFFPYFI